jgi:hypothetical protein
MVNCFAVSKIAKLYKGKNYDISEGVLKTPRVVNAPGEILFLMCCSIDLGQTGLYFRTSIKA